MLTARQRADRRWMQNKTAWPCIWCNARSFATERGRNRHHLYCNKNPAAKRFTEGGHDGTGEYEAFFNPHGDVIGMVWRGNSEMQGAKIKREMRETLGAIGLVIP